MSQLESERAARVLIETLRQSGLSKNLELEDIAAESGSSKSTTRTILTRILGDIDNDSFTLDSKKRVQLALEVARAGRLKEATHALNWQEFESFGAECLVEAGFKTEKNVRVKGDNRRWQIDLVGYRGDLALTIDCKHWSSSGYRSRLEPQAKHQRLATAHLLRTLAAESNHRMDDLQGLAVVLTLLEPPTRLLEKAALVGVEKLPSFLSAVTPYDASLPLISMSEFRDESPMS